MAIAKAYGSITIVDIGDLGTLSVYPESNQPTSVIYDPNTNGGTYNPNWTSANLQLTPIIYYGGTQIDATNTAISVVWQRKVGSGDPIAISASNGESMSNSSKKLTVNKNILNSSNPIITYICTVNYEEPQTGTELTAKGQISFSLISQPTSIKSCSIVGESVFLYGSDQSIMGAESITLTAKLSNCDVANWQYKDASGNWVTISGQVSSTLTINASDSYFVNDVATIRLNTNINTLYDLHSITNIRHGAPGEGTLAVSLSNEDMYVPCDKVGNILAGGLDNAKTEIAIYNGNNNVTNDAKTNIGVEVSGVSGKWIVEKTNDGSETSKPTYKVEGMSAMTGTVTFTITYTEDGNSKIIKKIFYLTKLLAGADGDSPEIYSMELSTVTLNKTADTHIYSPSTFTASAYKTVGSTKTAYSGRFKIYANGSDTASYTSNNDETSCTFEPTKGTAYSVFKVELYEAGSFTTRRDSQTITVISDGAKGDEGAGGLSFVLGNYSDHIPCTTGGLTSSNYTITIPFAAYQGTNRVACNATLSTLPNGMSCDVSKDITPATTTTNGTIKIAVAGNQNLGGTTPAYDTGTIMVTLTTMDLAVNQSTQKAYTWTKNRQAASGANAVLLRTYAPNGNIINNGENDVTLSCTLTEGTTTVSPTSYKWYVFDNNATPPGYVQITGDKDFGGHTGYTTNTLTVPATAVSSYASYCVEVEYKTKSYKDYISVQDKTDPLQVEIFSTLGDKITNSVGVGCIYARVFQDGVELDELQNLKVSTIEPSSPLEGDVWAHIDQSTQKIILKKRVGSSWTAFTLSNTQCNYKWTFGDYDGVATNLNNQTNSTAKFLYVQGSYITKKMQFNLEVTKQ